MSKIRMPTTKRQILRRKRVKLKKLTNMTIRDTVTGIQKAIRENYVFKEKSESLCRSLEDHYSCGDYDHITDWKILCQQLTQHLRDIVNDKHLQVLLPEEVPHILHHGDTSKIELERGIDKVEILPGNVGYVNIIMFNPLHVSSDEIEGAMQFVKNTTALIFDLRKCRGGSADSVNFLLSYFFNSKSPLVLLETYFRPQNRTFKSKTTRTPFKYENPVYVLTSSFTFSGGEHFAFALKVHKRAKLVGTRTGGGAHPVALVSLDKGILFKVPIGRTYDPETDEDWEGTGIAPDIMCSEDNALIQTQKDIASS